MDRSSTSVRHHSSSHSSHSTSNNSISSRMKIKLETPDTTNTGTHESKSYPVQYQLNPHSKCCAVSELIE